MTKLRSLAFGVGVLVLFGACEHGDPVSPAGGPSGQVQLFVPSGASSGSLPAGSVTPFLRFIGFGEGVSDPLGRKPTGIWAQRGRYWKSDDDDLFWRYQPDVFRNSDPATIDPRYPFLSTTTVPVPNTSDFGPWDVYSPLIEGDDFWESAVALADLKPNTTYQVMFVHYRLKVVGLEDHLDRILNGTVSEPDSLLVVSGTPRSVNGDWTNSAPAGCSPYPGTDANPFIFATFVSTASGTTANAGPGGIVDKCWLSTNGISTLAQEEANNQATSMVGRSDDTPYDLPNYNYLEVWEGAYGTGTPVLRIQIAQDLDRAGTPVPSSYPPFPAPGTKQQDSDQGKIPSIEQAAAFPVENSVKFGLPATIALPDSVLITLRNLQPLSSGVYKVWYVNPQTAAAVAAPGRYVRTVGGVTADSAENTSTFTGGPGTITFLTNPYDASIAPNTPADSLKVILITKEASADASEPSASQVLWRGDIFKLPGSSSAGGTLKFGTFNSGTGPVLFTPQGSMSGGVIGGLTTSGDSSLFSPSLIQVSFRGLMRPPVGYEYHGYLSKTDSAGVESAVDLGPIVGRGGEDLSNADDPSVSGPGLTATAILSATLTFDLAHPPAGVSVDQVCSYDTFSLRLQAKNGTPPSPTVIFSTPVPAAITAATCQ